MKVASGLALHARPLQRHDHPTVLGPVPQQLLVLREHEEVLLALVVATQPLSLTLWGKKETRTVRPHNQLLSFVISMFLYGKCPLDQQISGLWISKYLSLYLFIHPSIHPSITMRTTVL